MKFELKDINDETFKIIKNIMGGEKVLISSIQLLYSHSKSMQAVAISEDGRSFLMREPVRGPAARRGLTFLFVSDGLVVHVVAGDWYGRNMKLYLDSQQSDTDLSKMVENLKAAFSVYGHLGNGKDTSNYHPEIVSIKFGSEEYKSDY